MDDSVTAVPLTEEQANGEQDKHISSFYSKHCLVHLPNVVLSCRQVSILAGKAQKSQIPKKIKPSRERAAQRCQSAIQALLQRVKVQQREDDIKQANDIRLCFSCKRYKEVPAQVPFPRILGRDTAAQSVTLARSSARLGPGLHKRRKGDTSSRASYIIAFSIFVDSGSLTGKRTSDQRKLILAERQSRKKT